MKLKPKTIQSTNWARNFKHTCPTGYKDAIELAKRIESGEIPEVRIYFNNKNGNWIWAIAPSGENVSRFDQEFWLDGKKLQKDAIAVCREMGWKSAHLYDHLEAAQLKCEAVNKLSKEKYWRYAEIVEEGTKYNMVQADLILCHQIN